MNFYCLLSVFRLIILIVTLTLEHIQLWRKEGKKGHNSTIRTFLTHYMETFIYRINLHQAWTNFTVAASSLTDS